jgi:hypothetical protein
MAGDSTSEVPRWLWYTVVGGLAAVLTAALGLIIALALGWNNPRPSGPPDWQASGLPRQVQAPSRSSVIELLGFPDGGGSSGSGGFILDGTMAPVAGSDFNGYGLAYRAQDATRYTAFAVGGDGYYAVLRVAGEEETPLVTWQQFPHIRRGREANRLRVECSGANCDFYINDEYATSVEDDVSIEGDFGLWVRSFDERAVEVEFTTVGVWLRQ